MQFDFEQQIGPAVRSTSNEIKRYMNACLESNGLTGIRAALLGFLSHTESDIYQRDVEKKFNIRRATATSLLQGLEEQGMITREAVVHDARLKRIVVTELGRKTAQEHHESIYEMEDRMRNGLSEEEVEQLLSLLARIRVNLGGRSDVLPPKE